MTLGYNIIKDLIKPTQFQEVTEMENGKRVFVTVGWMDNLLTDTY